MPSRSMSRRTKSQAVSRYWTQYSRGGCWPVQSWKSRNPWSLKTVAMISGTGWFWKMRQSELRDRNQSHGTIQAR